MPKRKLLPRSRIQPKRLKVEFRLPPEIWQKIFLDLPFEDLLEARRTCRHWLDIIGSCPRLRDKFLLKFPHAPSITKINRNYKPPGTLPASNVEFKLCNYSKIGSINAWWPRVASTVTCLVMGGCDFPIEMLRYASNLKSLELDVAQIGGSGGGSFKLMNLRSLSLKNTNPGPLGRMITQLESFECVIDEEHDAELNAIVELIRSAKNTLTELGLEVPPSYLKTFSLLTELKLKKVYFLDKYWCTPVFEEGVLHIVRAHSSLEELVLVNPLDLDDVLKTLPGLKKLFLRFPYLLVDKDSVLFPEWNVLPPFPKLSNLEYLQINCEESVSWPQLQTQHGVRLPMLKELYLNSVFVPGNSLNELLQHSPDLRYMTLKSCGFDSWHQLLSIITQPKRLQRLTFSASEVSTVEDDPFVSQEPVTSLKLLKIGDLWDVPSDKERTVFRLFPEVTEVELTGTVLDDGLIEEMCRSLPRLEKLTAYGQGTSRESGTYLRQYCPKLRYLWTDEQWTMKMADLIYFTEHLDNFYYRRVDFSGLKETILEALKELTEMEAGAGL